LQPGRSNAPVAGVAATPLPAGEYWVVSDEPKDRANDKPKRLTCLRDLERIIFSQPSGVAIFCYHKTEAET
jgi:hypothetical protein